MIFRVVSALRTLLRKDGPPLSTEKHTHTLRGKHLPSISVSYFIFSDIGHGILLGSFESNRLNSLTLLRKLELNEEAKKQVILTAKVKIEELNSANREIINNLKRFCDH